MVIGMRETQGQIYICLYISYICLSGKEFFQCMTHGFDPYIGKIPWRRKRQPTPIFLLGKSHGQRSLGGLQAMESLLKESDMTCTLNSHTHINLKIKFLGYSFYQRLIKTKQTY